MWVAQVNDLTGEWSEDWNEAMLFADRKQINEMSGRIIVPVNYNSRSGRVTMIVAEGGKSKWVI